MFSAIKTELTLATVATGVNPGIKPDMSAPWMDALRQVGGWILGSVIVALAIFGVIAVIVWIAGKVSGSGRTQEASLSTLLWILLGAAIVGGISGAIAWAGGIQLF